MANGKFRARLQGSADLRYLTDGEAQALLSADKRIDESVAWADKTDRDVRMNVAVVGEFNETLYLTGHVNRARPGASNWALVWGRKSAKEHPESIRRLDLRDRHRNPDGELWQRQTHKHRWSEADNNRWAYTPDDIPHDASASTVVADDYRAIFEAFAAECGVGLGPGYSWTEPGLTVPPGQKGLWEP